MTDLTKERRAEMREEADGVEDVLVASAELLALLDGYDNTEAIKRLNTLRSGFVSSAVAAAVQAERTLLADLCKPNMEAGDEWGAGYIHGCEKCEAAIRARMTASTGGTT